MPECADRGAEPVRDEVFTERTHHGVDYTPMRAVRTDRYKLIRHFEPGTPPPMPTDVRNCLSARTLPERLTRPRPGEELYDLGEDPWETNNLAGTPEAEAIQRHLSERLDQWMRDTVDPLLDGPIRLPGERARA